MIEILADGNGFAALAPGDSVDIDIVLTIRGIDSGFAFANLFFDDDDNASDGEIGVTSSTQPLDGVYDDAAFSLPADLSWNEGNEYGLVYGLQGGDEFGTGSYVLSTITVTHEGNAMDGIVPVTFELGVRSPQVYTSDFVQYEWGTGLDGVEPDMLDPGVGGAAAPFVITLIPEPTWGGVLLLATALVWLRDPHRSTR